MSFVGERENNLFSRHEGKTAEFPVTHYSDKTGHLRRSKANRVQLKERLDLFFSNKDLAWVLKRGMRTIRNDERY